MKSIPKKLIWVALVCAVVGVFVGLTHKYFSMHRANSGESPRAAESHELKDNIALNAPMISKAFYSLSGDEKLLAVFVYSTAGHCPEIRKRESRALVVVLPRAIIGSGKIDRKEIKQCFDLDIGNPKHPVSIHCVDGFLSLVPTLSEGEMMMEYSFTLQDGSQRFGKLTAAYCPKSP